MQDGFWRYSILLSFDAIVHFYYLLVKVAWSFCPSIFRWKTCQYVNISIYSCTHIRTENCFLNNLQGLSSLEARSSVDVCVCTWESSRVSCVVWELPPPQTALRSASPAPSWPRLSRSPAQTQPVKMWSVGRLGGLMPDIPGCQTEGEHTPNKITQNIPKHSIHSGITTETGLTNVWSRGECLQQCFLSLPWSHTIFWCFGNHNHDLSEPRAHCQTKCHIINLFQTQHLYLIAGDVNRRQ